MGGFRRRVGLHKCRVVGGEVSVVRGVVVKNELLPRVIGIKLFNLRPFTDVG